jgi:hypothetical protein
MAAAWLMAGSSVRACVCSQAVVFAYRNQHVEALICSLVGHMAAMNS